MTKLDIMACDDIEVLKQVCLNQRTVITTIRDLLTDEGKQYTSAKLTVDTIRDYITKNQSLYDDIDYVKDHYCDDERDWVIKSMAYHIGMIRHPNAYDVSDEEVESIMREFGVEHD